MGFTIFHDKIKKWRTHQAKPQNQIFETISLQPNSVLIVEKYHFLKKIYEDVWLKYSENRETVK